ELPKAAEIPVDLFAAGEEDPAQDHRRNAPRVRPGIRQRQRGAPGAAEEHRLLEPQALVQDLDILDQPRGSVLLGAPARNRAAAAALVEEHHAIEPRIEKAP